MDLFSSGSTKEINLLPGDGQVFYYGVIMPQVKAKSFFDHLMSHIEWKNDETIIFGKRIVTKRKVAWYGDPGLAYRYSGITRQALPWTNGLSEIKELTEEITGEKYNSCLLNLYHDGGEGMSWHSDAEKELKKNGAIASLSFGAGRKFLFRHKTSGETVSVLLEPGSLLLMAGETQTHWLHRLPTSKKVLLPRVNLTFRSVNLKA